MTAPKKPKALKRPKQSASLQTWENFEKRVKDQKKRYSDKVRIYNVSKAKKVTDKKKKEQIISRTRG